jgi:hypothetical protein
MDTIKPIRVGNPVDSLRDSLGFALSRDLLGSPEGVRPTQAECRVYLFEQLWLSSALGFPRQVQNPRDAVAYTVVVIGPRKDVCVYFAGELAYHIKRPTTFFWTDLTWNRLQPVVDAAEYDISRLRT